MGDEETIGQQVSSSLFDRISQFFTNIWQDFTKSLAGPEDPNDASLMNELWKAGSAVNMSTDSVAMFTPLDDQKIPQPVADAIENAKNNPSFFNSIWLAVLNVAYHAGYLFSILPAIYGAESLEANKKYTPTPIDLSILSEIRHRDNSLNDYTTEKAQENGFKLEDIETMFEAMTPLLSVNDIQLLYNRNIIDASTAAEKLAKLGYNEENQALIKELFNLLPPLSDMVRMAVREAFSPAIIDAYGLHDNLPSDFINNAGLLGLNEEWAKAYWAAHWELPSTTAAFEMYHRGIINDAELNTLLQTKDIMPYWRNKLIQIAYNNYTRVDVRRMHKLGILNEDDVYRSYKDLGYNDDKAANMTAFTIQYNAEDNNSATKNDILDSYEKGAIDEQTTKEYLQSLNYDEASIGYFIAKTEYDKAIKEKNTRLDIIKKQYVKGLFPPEEIHNKLNALNMPAAEIKTTVELWDIERLARDKTFPRSVLNRLYREKKISEQEFRDELRKSGYQDKYIDWFILDEQED